MPNYAELAKSFGGIPFIDYDALAAKFGGIALEAKPVHHASNDIDDLRASAERQSETVGDAVAKATKGVDGAKVEAVRDAKDADRIEDKAERQNVQPSQIGDIAGAKVSVPDQPAANQVLENLHKEMPVESANGAVTGEPGKNSVRQTQAIVDTNAPAGEPVKKAEVMLQTPEMAKATDETHDDYRKAQELRAQGKEAEAQAVESEIAKTHEAAEQRARQRQGESNAIQERSPAEVHGSPQGSNEKEGREPERVGGQNRLQETPGARSEEALPENLKNQLIEVRDPSSGEWKRGTVLADVVGGGNNGIRRLRGVYDDGGKFDNVKAQDVRPVARPDVGVDFDGTLFKENSDGSIGAPIPERIASLKQDIAAGKQIQIESHRAGHPGGAEQIHAALESVGLPRLPVTPKKNAASELIDNEKQVQPGVKLDKVATDANTPLPTVTRSGVPIPPSVRRANESKATQVAGAPKPEPVSAATPSEKDSSDGVRDAGKNAPPRRADRQSKQQPSLKSNAAISHSEAFNLAKEKLGKDAKWSDLLQTAAEIQQSK